MILVTGANGFLGKRICTGLIGNGHRVLGLDKTHRAVDEGAAFVQCDLCDAEAVERVLEEHPIETIVHLAALLRTVCIADPQLAARVNIGGSASLFAAAKKLNVRRIVFGSSITVYGTVSATAEGVTEDYPPAPEDAYGGSKRYVEIMGETCQARGDFEFVAARIASVVGPGSDSATSPWRSDIFERLAASTRAAIRFPSASDQALPLVHVEDVAQMIGRLVESTTMRHSVYNAPSQTYTFGELANHVTSINPQIQIAFGESQVVGHPHRVDASQFCSEFNLCPPSLESRLRASASDAMSPDST